MQKNQDTKRKKVLIAEDEKFLGEILLTKFSSVGYATTLARDGVEALEKIRALKPDVVLLDILMPRMDGYQVLETMAKEGLTETSAVIIISNSGQPVEIDRALKLGAKDYLVKVQFNPDEVLAKVRQQLEPPAKKPNAGANKKILMVEDDQFLRELAIKKFRLAGYEIVTAADGAEALALVEQKQPALILLDIILPGIDGFEVLRALSANAQSKDIPVIILSNLGQESDIDRGKKLGAVEYLVKTEFTLDEILKKIKKLIG